MKKKSKVQIEYDKKFNKIVEKLHGKKTAISIEVPKESEKPKESVSILSENIKKKILILIKVLEIYY